MMTTMYVMWAERLCLKRSLMQAVHGNIVLNSSTG